MAVPLPLQNVIHESHVISISQCYFTVTQVILQRAVEKAEQQIIGERGGILERVFVLCYRGQQREVCVKQQHSNLINNHSLIFLFFFISNFEYSVECIIKYIILNNGKEYGMTMNKRVHPPKLSDQLRRALVRGIHQEAKGKSQCDATTTITVKMVLCKALYTVSV